MAQNLLPFQYLNGKNESGLTSFAGLPLYMEMAMATGLNDTIAETLHSKTRGWSDQQMLLSLILLNIAGGDCVADIEKLELDEGLSTLLLKIETYGMKRSEQRSYERRWRKRKNRAFPSVSAIHRYLEQFHNEKEETLRIKGKSFIPSTNGLLESLLKINSSLVDFSQKRNPSVTATLDQDATLAATHKSSALYCYEKYKAYQPFNTYWVEQGLLIHSEFRDGNVPAGFEPLRILKESLEQLPAGVKKVFFRSDSAGYQKNLLSYCAEGENERFGVIEFATSIKVTQSFKEAVALIDESAWQPIYKELDGAKIKTEQEFAEVCFVPTWAGLSKKNPDYRFISIRERMSAQLELEEIEPLQQELPFQTIKFKTGEYKLFGIVTNRDLHGNDLINWHRKRCGDSEKVHSIEKNDLAGGQFPSNKFGANAAWWQIMVMAFNLNSLTKALVFPKKLKKKRLKGLRFHVIHIAGQVVKHARGLFIKLSGGEGTADIFYQTRQNIYNLANAPPLLI